MKNEKLPLIETKYTLQDVLSKKVECDILILEGAFRDDLIKYSMDVSKAIDYYAQKSKYIITVGSCATFGGVFKEYDPKNISGFGFPGILLFEVRSQKVNPKQVSF